MKTVTRKGFDKITTEEVKTPLRGPKNGSLTSQPQQSLSSPTKRLKLDPFEDEPIPWNIDGHEGSGKRQTLVFLHSW